MDHKLGVALGVYCGRKGCRKAPAAYKLVCLDHAAKPLAKVAG